MAYGVNVNKVSSFGIRETETLWFADQDARDRYYAAHMAKPDQPLTKSEFVEKLSYDFDVSFEKVEGTPPADATIHP